jgi:hypothetical protein
VEIVRAMYDAFGRDEFGSAVEYLHPEMATASPARGSYSVWWRSRPVVSFGPRDSPAILGVPEVARLNLPAFGSNTIRL